MLGANIRSSGMPAQLHTTPVERRRSSSTARYTRSWWASKTLFLRLLLISCRFYYKGLTTKLYPWDESIRVPSWRVTRGGSGPGDATCKRRSTRQIFCSTLLGLAGIRIRNSVEGADHSPIMSGWQSGSGGGVLLALPVPITEARRYGFAEYRGLRTPRYTYVTVINISGRMRHH